MDLHYPKASRMCLARGYALPQRICRFVLALTSTSTQQEGPPIGGAVVRNATSLIPQRLSLAITFCENVRALPDSYGELTAATTRHQPFM